ncbi:MAG TPA: Gfo/Idh/MocA family oxidoreductase, partial [Armatimonadota bacterium]|nr:Gfo/Idh/MocA family oxidoreductase [Armatimonadota bacterium]
MNPDENTLTSRRQFLKTAGGAAAASALSGVSLPAVHAAGSDLIQVALVGCGGRGSGAAVNALSTTSGPIKMVAMADAYQDRLRSSYDNLSKSEIGKQMDVPEARKFIGWDAYKSAMDALKPGDVVILTTPPAFRWVHFTYAIQKGLNVFMEKPVTVDGPTSKRMLKLAEDASAKNLKVGVGLMCRHCDARRELFERIRMGQIGDIITMRAYRVHGPVAECFVPQNPGKISDTLYQIQKFHAFLWASGGLFSDFYIHNIDECCWMKDAWPVRAKASGARCYREDKIDQNFDEYSVEYTFADGTKFFLEGRNIAGCDSEFASYAHGTKGSAVISTKGHTPARCRIYHGQHIDDTQLAWAYPPEERSPYRVEWISLIDAIRN